MHMLKMTSERNSSLGVSSCGLWGYHHVVSGGIIMWSKMGKQNLQAKKVYCAHLCSLGFYQDASSCTGAFVVKGLLRGESFVFKIYIFTVLLKRKIYDTLSINSTYILQVKFDFGKTF